MNLRLYNVKIHLIFIEISKKSQKLSTKLKKKLPPSMNFEVILHLTKTFVFKMLAFTKVSIKVGKHHETFSQ